MADRLSIYRGALMHLGDGRLASLTEQNSRRFALDDVWEKSVNFLLEQGLWNFAIRTVELSADDDYEPLFGYQYSFQQPSDWIRTNSISDDPYFRQGYELYQEDNGYWFADLETLYVRYVSNDAQYGWNIGRWREGFAQALEAYLAFRCGLPISNDKSNRNDLYGLYEKLLKTAKIRDAVDEAVVYPPSGRLVRSRFGGRTRLNPSREI